MDNVPEPLAVAGSFTLDGRASAFVDSIEGDPSNVIGLSLPLFRTLLAAVGLWLTETLWLKPYRPEPRPAAFESAGLDFGRHCAAVTGVGSKLDQYAVGP